MDKRSRGQRCTTTSAGLGNDLISKTSEKQKMRGRRPEKFQQKLGKRQPAGPGAYRRMPPPGWLEGGRLLGPWATRPQLPAQSRRCLVPGPGCRSRTPLGSGEQRLSDHQQGGDDGPRDAQSPAKTFPGSARTRRRAPLQAGHPRRAPARPEPYPGGPGFPVRAA